MPAHRANYQVVWLTISVAALLIVSAAMMVAIASGQQRGIRQQLAALIAGSTIFLLLLVYQQIRSGRAQTRLYVELNALMEGTPQVLLFVDEKGAPRRWNDRLLRATGIGREALRSLRITDLFDETDRPAVVQAMDSALALGHYECEIPLRCVTGSIDFSWVFSRNDPMVAGGALVAISGRDISDRLAAQRELLESEIRYRELFEQIHDATFMSERGAIIDVNAAATHLFGYSRNEMVGMSVSALTFPYRESFLDEVLSNGGVVHEYPAEMRRRDGTALDCLVSSSVRFDEAGAMIGCQGIIRDVSERKRFETALRQSEQDYRALFDNAHDAILILETEQEIVLDANARACAVYGWSYGDFVGRSMLDLSVDATRGGEYVAEALQSGRSFSFESQQLRSDGTVMEVEINAAYVTYQNRPAIVSINRDVTERKRLEGAQQEMMSVVQDVATEWTTTFDAVRTPIVLLDEERQIRRLNDAARRLADRQYSRLLGHDVLDLEGEPWQTIAAVADFHGSHGTTGEARAVDSISKRVFQIESTAVDLNGEPRLIVTAHELTLLTQLEESLRQAEIAAALGAVVAGVAHEVRNPLFTISAILDTWEAKLGTTPELLRYMDPLREEIGRLNTLMYDLLEYGKPHPLDPQPVSVVSVLCAATAQNRAASSRGNVEVVFDAPDEMPLALIDETRMQQVFRNVIENAIQHSPADGRVIVRIGEDAGGITCEVRDSGCGLSPADLESAFVPFYTRRPGGTGLGLAIARKIVLAHGGEISLRNGDDGGAVATIRLPLAPDIPLAANGVY